MNNQQIKETSTKIGLGKRQVNKVVDNIQFASSEKNKTSSVSSAVSCSIFTTPQKKLSKQVWDNLTNKTQKKTDYQKAQEDVRRSVFGE